MPFRAYGTSTKMHIYTTIPLKLVVYGVKVQLHSAYGTVTKIYLLFTGPVKTCMTYV